MNKLIALFLCLALAAGTAGCASEPDAPEPNSQESIQYATSEPASLQDVLELIYEDVQMRGLSDAGDDAMQTLFHLDLSLVSDYATRYTSGRFGVYDVVLIRAVEGQADEIINSLEMRRDDRIAEFENYDVFDSLDTAKNAEIFTRGNYVIMLMVPDTEAARNIILEHIPG